MNIWTEKLNDNPVDWLLNSNPWTKYKTYIDLLDFKESDTGSVKAKTR